MSATEDEKMRLVEKLKKFTENEAANDAGPTQEENLNKIKEDKEDIKDEMFNLERLMTDGIVTKTIEDGKVIARFSTVSSDTIFNIDSSTDMITFNPSSNNSRRSFRYMCASIEGYGIKGGKYIDLSNEKKWEDIEEKLLKVPSVLINKLLDLHVKFERKVSLLYDKDQVKNL